MPQDPLITPVDRMLREATNENVSSTADLLHSMDFNDAARAIPLGVQWSISAAHEILQCVSRIEHLADYASDDAVNYAADMLSVECDSSLGPYKHERRALNAAVAAYLRDMSRYNRD